MDKKKTQSAVVLTKVQISLTKHNSQIQRIQEAQIPPKVIFFFLADYTEGKF